MTKPFILRTSQPKTDFFTVLLGMSFVRAASKSLSATWPAGDACDGHVAVRGRTMQHSDCQAALTSMPGMENWLKLRIQELGARLGCTEFSTCCLGLGRDSLRRSPEIHSRQRPV